MVRILTALVAAAAAQLLFGSALAQEMGESGYVEMELETVSVSAPDIGLIDEHGSDHDLMMGGGSIQGEMVGVLWDSDEILEVWVRSRTGGDWSEWTEVGSHPDPDGRAGSDPVWVAGASAVEVALSGNPPGLRLAVIDVPEEAAFVPEQAAQAPLDPSGALPRSGWDTGATCRKPGAAVEYSEVRALVVHHTVTTNSYSSSQVAGLIDGICSFHVNGRGWDDIGYNFLVDRFGRVWEGRTGGTTNGVRGAHAVGFNEWTAGIALLGDFQSTSVPTAQRSGLVDIASFLTGWYEIDPRGSVQLTSSADQARYSEGTSATLPSIMGHRDVNFTTCPGGSAYATLPSVRSAVVPGSARPATSPDGDEVFLYDSDNGIYVTRDVFSDGTFQATAKRGSIGEGWQIVEDLDVNGDGVDEIFLYSGTSRSSRIHRLGSGGQVSATTWSGPLGAGWDEVEPIDVDGDGADELLFYRRSDGRFALYDVRSNGTLGSAIRVANWGRGWTSVEPIDINGDGLDEIMYYRSSDGRFGYYNMSGAGTIGTAVRVDNIGTRWDTIEPTDLDGDGTDEMYFYRQATGRFAYYDLTTTGFIGSALTSGDEIDWTSIVSPNLPEG